VGRLQALTTNITGDMSQQPIEMQIRRVENRACPPPTSQVVGWQENTGGEWQPSPDIGSGLAWQDILVVMLPGKAAEIIGVLSLGGSSKGGTSVSYSIRVDDGSFTQKLAGGPVVVVWW
jgi:hypothetical protein